MSDNEEFICLICSDNCLNNYIKYPLLNGSCKCVYYIHQECQTIMNNEWGNKCPICNEVKNLNETKIIIETTEIIPNLDETTDIISNENIITINNNFRHEQEKTREKCNKCCIIIFVVLLSVGLITFVSKYLSL